MFENFKRVANDPILSLIELYKNDKRLDKIDVGVGVFQNEFGKTPIMESVTKAAKILIENEHTKSYIGLNGLESFNREMIKLVFGSDLSRVQGVQAVGGSGALRVCSDMLYKKSPRKTIWISNPTWGNHRPIFEASGFNVKTYRYLDESSKKVDEIGLLEDLSKLGSNDIVLLHGCCHNPTGAEISNDMWDDIAEIALKKGFLPFIDLAYQGFGEGLETDVYGLRKLAMTLPNMIVTSSCSKNFGLYRERVGCAMVMAATENKAKDVQSHISSASRVLCSMPPNFGANLVSIILQDEELRTNWGAELGSMRKRVQVIRKDLSSELREITNTNKWDYIEKHSGMFSLLCLDKTKTDILINKHSIYIVDGGRINIAGIRNTEQLKRFARVLAEL